MESSEGMMSCHLWKGNGSMPCKMLHRIGTWVQTFQLGGLNLVARLHPVPQLPLPNLSVAHLALPQLALPHAWVCVVQAWHVVSQQGVCRVQGHEEGVIAVGGRHDVRASVLAQGAQGRGVWPDVWRYGSDGRRGRLEGRPHVRPTHLRISHPPIMG